MAQEGKNQDNLHAMRHSLAHIMAAAVQQLWPKAKFGIGPVVENGFYYDIDIGKAVAEEDLGKIEAEMRKIIKADLLFEQYDLSIDKAIDWAKQNKQDFKAELLTDLQHKGTTAVKDVETDGVVAEKAQKVSSVSFYKVADFEDLCRGPHVKSTGKVGAFKLHKIAGAYWRGDEKNPQLQRIYGVAFPTEKEVKDYFERLEEAKRRDHRVIGDKLGIFMNSTEVGSGLPLMLPRGETLKHTLMQYMRRKEKLLGYQYVSTPVLAHEDLYKRSGHTQYFSNEMYKLKDHEGNVFYLKPMNCPHHHQIYENMVQSYRDLPLKLAEPGPVYRNELSGVLSGLIRVRGPITQNDAHIYTTQNQLENEFLQVLELFDEVYKETGVADYWFRLSLPDFEAKKFGGDKELWGDVSEVIRKAMKKFGAEFEEVQGEAAFYGPKIDVQIRNVLGKEDTLCTIQVDILVPERMGLKYIDEKDKEQQPVIIHRAILGSYERFMAFLLEQTEGNLPIWLAPEQVRLVTVNDSDQLTKYAAKVHEQLTEASLRAEIDASSETVGKKVRNAELIKVPYVLVVGEEEVKSGKFKPRVRADIAIKHKEEPVALEQFIQTVVNEVKSHVHHSSL